MGWWVVKEGGEGGAQHVANIGPAWNWAAELGSTRSGQGLREERGESLWKDADKRPAVLPPSGEFCNFRSKLMRLVRKKKSANVEMRQFQN